MIVFLDSGIVWTICSLSNTPEVSSCINWFYSLMARGVYIVSSDICDYEIRRELLRRDYANQINKLDELRKEIDFLPISKEILVKASELWALARKNNQPTSYGEDIDVDMLISAQYLSLKELYPGREIIIATTNVRHLKLFTLAKGWTEIKF